MEGDWRRGISLSISWNDSKKEKKGKVLALLVASALSLFTLNPATRTTMAEGMGELVSVIVREQPGAGTQPEEAVERLGGAVELPLGIIGGFRAEVPADRLRHLAAARGVHSVTPDASVRFSGSSGGYEADEDAGSMYSVAQEEIGAGEYWNDGYTGEGIDVALIDTGVVPVNGLTSPGKVVNGPDLSFESMHPEVRYLDTFGHGTHMAGIIAGRDDGAPKHIQKGNKEDFLGVAPDARIVNVKVGNDTGAADVSQVIAGISWVVQHRNSHGLNIRVLNLSFGTDGVQDYMLDPLTYAVEVAWRKGIVVVVAAGNEGLGTPKLNNPAYDPYVIAVGSTVQDGKYGTDGDRVAEWSSGGNRERRPDLVAPGKSIVSLRDQGSYVDEAHPEARVGDRFFRGTGTSQSAAVVSGAVALMLDQRPWMNPDQVKALLTRTAGRVSGDRQAQGEGAIDLKEARDRWFFALLFARQRHPEATGTGSLDGARGSAVVVDEETGVELTGDVDVFGQPWDAGAYSQHLMNDTSWQDGVYNGSEWTGGCFCDDAWAGKAWAGKAWAGSDWAGKAWAGKAWAGKAWAGKAWAGKAWAGKAWA